MEIEVCVYRSETRADTYVYLPSTVEFVELPEDFRAHFGIATVFLNFLLHEDKELAQADPKAVLAAIDAQGFYLQLPPVPEAVRDQAGP